MTIRSCLLLCLLSLSWMPSSVRGQGGMGGGMGGPFQNFSPLQVVILLGEDYDYAKPPFMSAQEVVRAFGPNEQTGTMIPGAPNLNSVRVDVKSSVPKTNERSVVAQYPKTLVGEALEEFKQTTKLNALRFGINQVVFLQADSIKKDEPRIWLREPYQNEAQLAKEAPTLYQISGSLADSAREDELASSARLDLFLPARQPKPSGMMGMGMGMDMGMDMDMGMGMDDMGMGMDDMGMDMGSGMDGGMYGGGMDMMMGVDPVPSQSSITKQKEKIDQQRADYQKRISALVALLQELGDAPVENRDHILQQLTEVVRADMDLARTNRSLDVQLLELKIADLKRRVRKQRESLDQLVADQVKELLNKKGE